MASTCHIWDLAAPYSASRFRVLAVDQRGHGESAKLDGEGDYIFEALTKDMDAFIQALSLERPVRVGQTWGENVAFRYAVDKLNGPSAMVFVDGGFLEVSLHPGMTRELVLLAASNGELVPLWSPPVVEIFLAGFQVSEGDSVTPRLRRENHTKILGALWEQKPSELYQRVSCPVLLVPASTENPTEERASQFKAHKEMTVALAENRLPRSQTLWMRDTIRDILLQRPKELAEAILRFCGGHTVL